MPILLKTRVKRTAKTLIPARRARVGGLCGFRSPAERVPIQQQKTRRCTAVRDRCGHGKRRKRTAAGEFQQREKPQAASKDKKADCRQNELGSRIFMGRVFGDYAECLHFYPSFSYGRIIAGERAGVGTDAPPSHFCPQCGQLTGFQRRRLWRLLTEISERLASLFPQAQVLQRKQACLTADWREL